MKKEFKIAILAIAIASLFTACKKDAIVSSKGNTFLLNKSLAPVPSSDNWELLPGTGTDISVGADGSVFAIDTTIVTTSTGYRVVKWNGTAWTVVSGGAGVRIAVDPSGMPWVVTKSNLIYKYNGSTWTLLPGTATDIGIGANGSVFAIDTTTASPTGGFRVVKWNGTGWTVMTGAAGVRVAVDSTGAPWVVNKSHLIFRYNGTTWSALSGTATDIGVGGHNSVYIVGTTIITSSGGYRISKWNGSGWTDTVSGVGINISVDPLGHPWAVNASHLIYRNLNL